MPRGPRMNLHLKSSGSQNKRVASSDPLSRPAKRVTGNAVYTEKKPDQKPTEEGVSLSTKDAVSLPAEGVVSLSTKDAVSLPAEDVVSVSTKDDVLVSAEGTVSLPAKDGVLLPAEDAVSLPAKDTVLLPAEDTVLLPAEDTESLPVKNYISLVFNSDALSQKIKNENFNEPFNFDEIDFFKTICDIFLSEMEVECTCGNKSTGRKICHDLVAITEKAILDMKATDDAELVKVKEEHLD